MSNRRKAKRPVTPRSLISLMREVEAYEAKLMQEQKIEEVQKNARG